MGIFSKEFLNRETSLIEFLNDEADLIFGESDELLEEIAHINGRDKMQIIIRNFTEDTTDVHGFSMKFIPSRHIEKEFLLYSLNFLK